MEVYHNAPCGGGGLSASHNEEITSPFCDCDFPKCVTLTCYKGSIPDLVTCRCGEEEKRSLEWQWKEDKGDTLICGQDVTFHPVYSQGTTIIRGEKPVSPKMVHFWEIRVITVLSGTDVMFGIGTDKVNLDKHKFRFVSALGLDNQSWGLSYHGFKHHNGEQTLYGNRFSQGCLIGIYLDLTKGHLEFFLNRRSLGIAYTNIPIDPNVQIYPMVSSTAARCAIRLINSTSQLDTLQLRAFKILSKQPKQIEDLRKMPGFKHILDSYWFLAQPVRYSHRSEKLDIDIADEAILSTRLIEKERSKVKKRQRCKVICSNVPKFSLHSFSDDSDDSMDGCNSDTNDSPNDLFYYLL